MSVTETTRYIYCRAIEWLRMSPRAIKYIYHQHLVPSFDKNISHAQKEDIPIIFSKKKSISKATD